MNTLPKLLALSLMLLGLETSAHAALCSRVVTFTDGSILTAADLESEFNNAIDCVNGITDANISTSAAIDPVKIKSSIVGSAMTRDSSTGALSPVPDNSTIEIAASALQLKDLGITTAKLGANSVTGAKLNSNTVDNATLQYTASQLSIKDGGVGTTQLADTAVTTAKITDASVTPAKIAASNYVVSSSSGNYFTASNSFTTVTNLSVSLTTVASRPVSLFLVPDGNSSNAAQIQTSSSGNFWWDITRDGTVIAYGYLSAGSVIGSFPPSAINAFDTGATAAAHTYAVNVMSSASQNIFVRYMKLVAWQPGA